MLPLPEKLMSSRVNQRSHGVLVAPSRHRSRGSRCGGSCPPGACWCTGGAGIGRVGGRADGTGHSARLRVPPASPGIGEARPSHHVPGSRRSGARRGVVVGHLPRAPQRRTPPRGPGPAGQEDAQAPGRAATRTVVELRHQAGGNSLYLKGDDGWYYCYLHINNDDPGTDNGANQFKHAFAPGLAIGSRGAHRRANRLRRRQRQRRGHRLALLHFEIRMPNAKWYNAAAVNAAYSLKAAEPAKLRARVSDAAFAPHPNATAYATAQATDFVGSVPSSGWLTAAEADLEGAVVSLDKFAESLLALPGATRVTAPTIRLYLGFFLRIPDYPGLDYWIRKVRAGTSLDTAASQFAAGSEFIRALRRRSTTRSTSRSSTATCSAGSPIPVASTTGSAASTAAPSAAGSCARCASRTSTGARRHRRCA